MRPAETRPLQDEGSDAWRSFGRAVLGTAIGTAAAWAFVPAETAQAVIALVLPVIAAFAGWKGGRVVGSATAISGALWFGYAHTEPRFHTEIAARVDVILTLAVLVVGVLASELADARRQLRQGQGGSVTG
jgi:K+-sensing histidine kinase KdpD